MSSPEVIEGWFELRFQESLLLTSVSRYQQHCEMREETKTTEEALRKKQEPCGSELYHAIFISFVKCSVNMYVQYVHPVQSLICSIC